MSNGGDMFDPHRPLGRLFYVLLVVLMILPSSQAQSPGTTTINDIVYRADECLNASIWAKTQ